MSSSVLPMFSSKSFIGSGLTFRSLIHFDFIFVYGVRKCPNFILLHVAVQFSQPRGLEASGLSQHQTQLWADKLWLLMVQQIRKCDFSAWVRSARRRKRLRWKEKFGENSGEMGHREAHSPLSRIHQFPWSMSQPLLHVPGSKAHAALQLENC